MIVFSRGDWDLRVPASGGEPVQLTTLDKNRVEAFSAVCQFLPDGRHFLYLAGAANARIAASSSEPWMPAQWETGGS